MKIYEIEGPDGVGKSTAIAQVLPKVQAAFPDRTVVRMALPGDFYTGARDVHKTKTARSLKAYGDQLVWSEELTEVSARTKRFLSQAERSRIAEELSKTLPEDSIVLSDRGMVSSHVYDYMLDEIQSGNLEVWENPDPLSSIAKVNQEYYPIAGVVFIFALFSKIVDKEDMPYDLKLLDDCYSTLEEQMSRRKYIQVGTVEGLREETADEIAQWIIEWNS